ncbi:hypothetical protein D3C77_645050 [compost metagenome]
MAQRHITHSSNSQRIVGQCQGVDARFLQSSRAIHKLADVQITRGIQFHNNGVTLLDQLHNTRLCCLFP